MREDVHAKLLIRKDRRVTRANAAAAAATLAEEKRLRRRLVVVYLQNETPACKRSRAKKSKKSKSV